MEPARRGALRCARAARSRALRRGGRQGSGSGGSSTSADSSPGPVRPDVRAPREPARGRTHPARGMPDSVALRASIVIGARSDRSASWCGWSSAAGPAGAGLAGYRTAPIDERDVVDLPRARRDRSRGAGRSLDIGGPGRRHLWRVDRPDPRPDAWTAPVIELPATDVTPIASRISAVIAGEEHALIGPLMEGWAPICCRVTSVRRSCSVCAALARRGDRTRAA